MDCFFHHAVPSVAACSECKKPVCATCRSAEGTCPSCVLAARLAAARNANMINGGVGPSSGTAYQAPPQPPPQPQAPPSSAPRVTVAPAGSLATVRPETRALVALSYPLWPLALLALLDTKGSYAVRRQAWQALVFNGGMWGFGALLGAIAALPVAGIAAWTLLPFVVPVWVVASVVYAYRAWQGDDVNIPIVSELVDARLTRTATH